MQDDGRSRRRFSRYTVEGVHGKMVFASQVEILNLSLGGVAITADRRLEIGAQYNLKLELGQRMAGVNGVVAWSVLTGLRKAEKGEAVPEYSAGLKFNDVLTDKLKDLIDFIDSNKVSEEHRLSGIRFEIKAPGKALIDTLGTYRVKLISLSGMLIETEHSLELEDVYEMQILASDDEPIRVSGRVASCLEVEEDKGPRHFEIGIEFVDMSAEDRSRLEAFVGRIAEG